MEREAGEPTCKSCKTAIPAGARFCPNCGARLVEQPVLPKTTAAAPGGEHRQITVMFCDLIGSTRLSTELHAEDLRELIGAYHEICATEIESRGGMIASYMGDGVMAYFGYPQASEDAAIRAADAGLGITRRVAQMGERLAAERGITLATRVALHTGRVLVGEIGAGVHRDRHAVTGVVPNLAARLESLAPRNGLVISEQTRALIHRAFRIDSIGSYDLKGIPQPVEVYRVLGRKPPASVLRDQRQKLIGRETELEALEAAWEKALSGAVVRVTVEAEPGVGKSALAARFIERARIEAAHIIEFAGSSGERNAPFACLRQTIARHLEAAGAGSADEVRQTLAGWLDAGTPEAASSQVPIPHVETMLAFWRGELAAGAEGRGAVFAAAAALFAAARPPLLVVLEDAHWIDPSTRELLDRILGDAAPKASGMGRLALALTRPGARLDWRRPDDVTLRLGRLATGSCRKLIEAVAGCRVEALLAQRIEAATDGLPLYVEEFTKALIESGHVHRQRGVLRGAELGSSIETPASLLDLITARLDTLGDAKVLAQIAAVLGRTFDDAALRAVSGRAAEEIETELAALEAAGILTTGASGGITFRHALFQKAAYESLLRSARRTWHRRYLDWLEAVPERIAAVRPETRAFHLEACGEHRSAAELYIEAGLAASSASASFEAAAHFRTASDLLALEPTDSRTLTDRLHAQVLLAGALLAARGPGAPETRAAYDQALHLAEAAPESDWHLAAYWGWWRVSETFALMAERARRLLEVSNRMRGAEFKLQAMHCAWANAFQMGELEAVRGQAKVGLELYEEAGFAHLRTLYGGHDCKVCALGEMGLAAWLMGAGDQAASHVDQALAHAEAIGHVGSLLHALDIAVMLHHYRRDGDAVARYAERLLALGTDYDLEEYRAKADIFLGWRAIDAGDPVAGLDRVSRGFQVLQEVGTPEDFPVYQCMRAEALRLLGDPDGALAALAGARAVIAEQGVAYWAAEIARQEAEVALSRDVPETELIAAKLEEARRIAVSQGALALELRASLTGLACARRLGGAEAASAAVAEVLARFEPGATGRDIDEARAALARALAR